MNSSRKDIWYHWHNLNYLYTDSFVSINWCYICSKFFCNNADTSILKYIILNTMFILTSCWLELALIPVLTMGAFKRTLAWTPARATKRRTTYERTKVHTKYFMIFLIDHLKILTKIFWNNWGNYLK